MGKNEMTPIPHDKITLGFFVACREPGGAVVTQDRIEPGFYIINHGDKKTVAEVFDYNGKRVYQIPGMHVAVGVEGIQNSIIRRIEL